MPSTTEALRDRNLAIAANHDYAAAKGKVHLARLAAEIRALDLPRGSYVIVEVASGAYVTAPSRLDALLTFRARYPEATGWACRIEDLPPCRG